MAQYSPKSFFRNVPNAILKQYFTRMGVLLEHDFSEIPETKIEPIYEDWLTLPSQKRGEMESDFKDIQLLACAGGIKAILDEAEFRNENINDQLDAQKGFYEKVFWVFLEKHEYWPAVTAFCRADLIASSQWNECKTIIKAPAKVDEASIKALADAISNYFYQKEGRGKNCKIEPYKRNNLDYFFAYPEDYAQSSVEWEGADFKRAARHPAFEIIFVYSQNEGKISLYMKGSKATKKEVRAIFADAILGLQLGEFVEDERVYDLAPLNTPDAVFKFSPEMGIESVAVKKLRLAINGTKERVILEASPLKNPDAVYDLRDKLFKNIPASQLTITQVGIVVTFTPDANLNKRQTTKSFEINWPNSCSLKHDGKDEVIRRMLIDSGIEPQAKQK